MWSSQKGTEKKKQTEDRGSFYIWGGRVGLLRELWTNIYREDRGNSTEWSEEAGEYGQRGQELGKDRFIWSEHRREEFGFFGYLLGFSK